MQKKQNVACNYRQKNFLLVHFSFIVFSVIIAFQQTQKRRKEEKKIKCHTPRLSKITEVEPLGIVKAATSTKSAPNKTSPSPPLFPPPSTLKEIPRRTLPRRAKRAICH